MRSTSLHSPPSSGTLRRLLACYYIPVHSFQYSRTVEWSGQVVTALLYAHKSPFQPATRSLTGSKPKRITGVNESLFMTCFEVRFACGCQFPLLFLRNRGGFLFAFSFLVGGRQAWDIRIERHDFESFASFNCLLLFRS